jgi:methyl-accepting chemotaxis protein
MIYRESQQFKRWQSRFVSFSNQVARLNVDKPEQEVLVRNILSSQKRLKEVFDSVASAAGSPSRNQGAAFDPTLLQVSWSRMAVQNRAVFFDTSRLSQILQDQRDQLTHRGNTIIFALIGLFVVCLLFYYVLVSRRALRSISALQAGTRIIGAGNLEYTLNPKHNDEIGELSQAFNRMTASLREVTASKAAFEKEVGERRKAEEQIQRYAEELRTSNEELAAFNRAMVGRELRMIELKKEVNDLCALAGHPPRHALEFDTEQR